MTHLDLASLSPRERIIVARALLAIRRPSERTLRDALRFLEHPAPLDPKFCSELRRVDVFLERVAKVLGDGQRLAAGAAAPAIAAAALTEGHRCQCGDEGPPRAAPSSPGACSLHVPGCCQNTATTHAATVGGRTFPLCSSCAAALGWS